MTFGSEACLASLNDTETTKSVRRRMGTFDELIEALNQSFKKQISEVVCR